MSNKSYHTILHISDNVQCTFKIVLQMHVLFEKLTATVESNLNKHTECLLKRIDNHLVVKINIRYTHFLTEF